MISLNIHVMTYQVLVWLFLIISVFYVPRYFDVYYVHQQIYVCLELKVKVLLESHPLHRPSLHVFPTAFVSTKLYCIVREAMDSLVVSIYSSAMTQSWLRVNVDSSLMSYLLHHHVTSLVCMSVVKISDKFIRPTTVFYGTDLLYQTQHEIQMTACVFYSFTVYICLLHLKQINLVC